VECIPELADLGMIYSAWARTRVLNIKMKDLLEGHFDNPHDFLVLAISISADMVKGVA